MPRRQDRDRDGNGQIVSGPEPSRLPKAADLAAAFRSLFAHRRAAAEPRKSRRKEQPARPARPRAMPVGGWPAIWMAPCFLAFAILFAFLHLAKFAAPADPRAFIAEWVGWLPERAAPLTDMLSGWLWLPWYVALAALIMRLQAVRATARGILDAVGWSLGALAIEGAAWLFFGRVMLAGPETPVAVRDGAWQLLVAEFVFLLLTSILFGPNTPKQTRFEQS